MFRIGIVGAGTMGSRYAQLLASPLVSPRAKLVGVCDVSLERARAVAERHGVAAHDDLERFLRQERPDAVYIAVPDDLHRDPVIAAAEHRVGILVEKPLATRLEDAVAAAEAVEAAGVVAEVNFSNRWNPPFVAARQSIEAGGIGEVLTINARLNNTISSPLQRLAWAGSTTPGWYLLSHATDLASWLGGKRAKSVYANGARRVLASLGVPTYDYIHAIVRYEDGTDAMLESAWVLPETSPSAVDFKFQILGTEGAIQIDTQDQMIHQSGRERHEYLPTLQWGVPRFHAFLDALETGRASVPLRDGVENTRILVAMHESLQTYEPVAV